MNARSTLVNSVLLLCVPLALGQSSSLPVDIGLQAYHDYHGGDIDHINLDTGNLTVSIPILSYPQRGNALKMDFGITYNGTGLTYSQVVCIQGKCQYGWIPTTRSYTSMSLTPGGFVSTPELFDLQDMASGYVKLAETGSNPTSYWLQTNWYTADGGAHPAGSAGSSQIALDGSGIQAGYSELPGPTPTITCTWDCSLPPVVSSPYQIGTRDGITYIGSGGGSSPGTARIDADGNYIVQNLSGFTDTAGRSIPLPVVNSSPTQQQTASCTGPLTVVEIATWNPPGPTSPYVFCYANVSLTLAVQETNGTIVISHPNQLMLQSIVLPNLQTWTFEYNEQLTNCPPMNDSTNLGDLTHITFPTGGTIDYTYTCIVPYGGLFPTHTTAVTSRTVNANDGTGPHTWQYAVGTGVNTFTDPVGNQSVYAINSSSYPTPNRVAQHYSGAQSGGTLLRTVVTQYAYATGSGYGLFPSSVTTTLENGLSNQTTFQVCCNIPFTFIQTGTQALPTSASYGKVTDSKVYDYGGAFLKETQTSYLFQTNSNYVNPGFFDLVSSQTVYNGSGTEMAQTSFGYDQTSRVTSGIASLTGAQMTTPIYGVYGHQTSKTNWLNTGPSNPTTNVSFYDTGEAYQVSDPLGHTTSTYFCTGSSPTTLPCSASTYFGALPTVVSDALGHQTSFTYRTDTGQKLIVTDPNLQPTKYAYSGDPLNRLTSVSYPDGGLTSIQYNDTGEIGVTVTQKITSTLNKQTQTVVDGLGRLSQTILLSDPSGPTYTLTIYDALGRKYQVWNPTRCQPITTNCGESTWGVSTHSYDALSRETLVIPPDGNATTDNQKTAFSGNETTVTDEAGNIRSIWSDALGRTTQVSEGSVGYLTAYFYDALEDLTCVEQHGGVTGTGCSSSPSNDNTSPWRVRRFTYDSLSRLLTAKNPETGTITYGYNLDGVLTTKTDARGITVTYTPESLHRVTQATYSDSTPTASFGYDAGMNGVGRRTSMTDGSGSTSWTYDPMGRILTEQQTIGTLNKTTTNVFWLDGSVEQTTYPSGSVLYLTQGGDGRPLSLTDTANNINYAKSLLYAPAGQLAGGTFGNISGGYGGIVETNSYNKRGQPIRLQDCGLSACTDGSGSQTPYLLDLGYNYGLGVNDNGNVQGITNNKNTARSQSFTYDGLNRLLTAQSGSSWGINFANGIEAWGNLIQTGAISGTGTNPMSVNQQVNLKNQFALNGYNYDAAGNVLTDGSGNTSCSGTTYTWNAEEEITCALGASYTYDGDGVRVKKTGGASTPTVYWGKGALTESDTSGNLTTEYIFLGGRRIARRDVVSHNVYYYFSDMLRSSNVVATATGGMENESDFYPFGGEAPITQNLTNQHYRFEGKERDPESGSLSQPQGLDNFGARFDSSISGRFMSPDWTNSPEPIPYAKLGNPQTLNLYAFAQNNPESAPDLDGHEEVAAQDDAGNPDGGENTTGDELTNFPFELAATRQKVVIQIPGTSIVVTAYVPMTDTEKFIFIAGLGHHGFPRSLYKFLENGPERRWLEREFVTGPLKGNHYYDAAHRAYNDAVRKLLKLETDEGRAEVAADVKGAAKRILNSDDPNIKGFLDNMKTPDGLSGREALGRAMEGDVEGLIDIVVDGVAGAAAFE